MLRPAPHIRYHIAAILVVDPVFSGAAHPARAGFVVQYKRWIRPSGMGYWNSGMLEHWAKCNPIIP